LAKVAVVESEEVDVVAVEVGERVAGVAK